jgi:hypothetical protein
MRNICAFDGKEFEATRADARYCSAACRAKASKARRRGEGAVVRVVDPEARDDPPEEVTGRRPDLRLRLRAARPAHRRRTCAARSFWARPL